MTKTAPLERQIHLGIVQLLNLCAAPGVVYFHVANERRTSAREGAFLRRMGVLAGVADFTLLIPSRVFLYSVTDNRGMEIARPAFLEIKRPGGKLSVAQEQFRDDVLAIGCLWGLAYSTDQAADLLRTWGALRPDAAVRRAA